MDCVVLEMEMSEHVILDHLGIKPSCPDLCLVTVLIVLSQFLPAQFHMLILLGQ
jgi:hypothetical protein